MKITREIGEFTVLRMGVLAGIPSELSKYTFVLRDDKPPVLLGGDIVTEKELDELTVQALKIVMDAAKQ